ncbi:MAG: iron-containing alcohol dehydrogenase [Planctomycetaceae bacterium]|nr:iron-containing alcohol dehydrogenase [Planctomycetaceae bacterium]
MWSFHLPTKIVFGRGTTGTLAALPELSNRRIVAVTDPVIARLPAVQAVIGQLAPVAVFDGVQPNPTVANVDTLAELLRKSQTEIIVAIGGGSSLDCAKAASCLAKTGEASIRPFHSEGKAFANGNIPVVAIPTTAGTGSEVTPISVLDDEEKNFKGPMASPLFYPVCAVVDPDLTLSVPLSVTAATALDALSHSIEGFWSKNHQPICDALAKEAAKTIFENLPKVYDNSGDPAARERLSYAALIAGIAFHMPKNAIMHACSYPLSNRAHLSHGAACAFTMEAAIRLNTPFMNGRMEEFSLACGFGAITEMIEAITTLKRRGGLPCTLKEAKIEPDMVETLIRESFHPVMKNNPKEVTEDDLRNIYKELAG